MGGKVLSDVEKPYLKTKEEKVKKVVSEVPDLEESKYICCLNDEDPNCAGIYDGKDEVKS